MNSGIIFAIVTAFATVLNCITKYYSNVKNVKQNRKRLYKKMKILHHVLKKIWNLIEGSNADKIFCLFSFVKKNCFFDIKNFETKLDPEKNRKTMKKLSVRALKWPFDKNEMDEYINRLEKHKNTIIAVLKMDQTWKNIFNKNSKPV